MHSVSKEIKIIVTTDTGQQWVPDTDNEVTYQLDAAGRRVAKLVDNVVQEKYLWAGHNTTLLAVYDGSDTLVARFEYGVGRMPVRMTQGSDTYYFAYDQVGSLRAVFDDAGALVVCGCASAKWKLVNLSKVTKRSLTKAVFRFSDSRNTTLTEE